MHLFRANYNLWGSTVLVAMSSGGGHWSNGWLATALFHVLLTWVCEAHEFLAKRQDFFLRAVSQGRKPIMCFSHIKSFRGIMQSSDWDDRLLSLLDRWTSQKQSIISDICRLVFLTPAWIGIVLFTQVSHIKTKNIFVPFHYSSFQKWVAVF